MLFERDAGCLHYLRPLVEVGLDRRGELRRRARRGGRSERGETVPDVIRFQNTHHLSIEALKDGLRRARGRSQTVPGRGLVAAQALYSAIIPSGSDPVGLTRQLAFMA